MALYSIAMRIRAAKIMFLGALAGVFGAGALADTLSRDAEQLARLWEGEFDNSRQARHFAAENRVPLKDRPTERLYIYQRVQHPEMRGIGLYAQQHYIINGKAGPAYRQRLYDIYPDAGRKEVVTAIYQFTPDDERRLLDAQRNPALAAAVPRVRLSTLPAGCEIFWKARGRGFVGYQREGDCVMDFPRSKTKMTLADDLTLDEQRFTTFTRANTLEGARVMGDAVPLELDRRGPPPKL